MFLQQPKEKEITRLGPDMKIKGVLSGESDVVIEGEFEGQIKTNAHVYVGKAAHIVASSVRVNSIRVDGVMQGEVKAISTLEIGSAGTITGNIECRVLSIESGAVLNGRCTMAQEIRPPPAVDPSSLRDDSSLRDSFVCG